MYRQKRKKKQKKKIKKLTTCGTTTSIVDCQKCEFLWKLWPRLVAYWYLFRKVLYWYVFAYCKKFSLFWSGTTNKSNLWERKSRKNLNNFSSYLSMASTILFWLQTFFLPYSFGLVSLTKYIFLWNIYL